MREKIKGVVTIGEVVARLAEANGSKPPAWITKDLREEWFAQMDPANLNGDDAEKIFWAGQQGCYWEYTINGTDYHAWGGYKPSFPKGDYRKAEPDERFRRRAVMRGLKFFREYIYRREGVYKYEPVK
jgi:hypothetical protein